MHAKHWTYSWKCNIMSASVSKITFDIILYDILEKSIPVLGTSATWVIHIENVLRSLYSPWNVLECFKKKVLQIKSVLKIDKQTEVQYPDHGCNLPNLSICWLLDWHSNSQHGKGKQFCVWSWNDPGRCSLTTCRIIWPWIISFQNHYSQIVQCPFFQ